METHTTVLAEESVNALNVDERSVIIDATVGQGGHSKSISEKMNGKGTLVCIDADETSLAAAEAALKGGRANILYVQGNFRSIKEHCARLGINTIDGALFDLGWHQGQLQSGRGFSFNEDAPLLMTLNKSPGAYQLTAADIIDGWNQDELENLFKSYGDEPFSGRIARVIVETRAHKKIQTAKELGEVVKSAVPARFRNGRIHPATRVFQALRMAVNDELHALEEGIRGAVDLLAPHGRVAVITFHSIEDACVKKIFRELDDNKVGFRVNKKVIAPTRAEILKNPRARSAKLRVFEKI